MPYKRYLIRAYNGYGVNGIYVINSQLQDLQGIATPTVSTVEIVHTGLVIGLSMPSVRVVLVHVVYVADSIRTHYIERQVNDAVATCLVEGEIVDTGFGQRAVSIGVTASLTDCLLDIRIGNVLNRQIQNMLYAVVTVLVFDSLEVTSCFSVC